MNQEKDFLGTGWSFPPTFERGGGVAMVSAKEDIEQSLGILLSTSLGERVLQPRYGCNLADYQFAEMEASFVGLLRDMVATAILYHEPRIRVEQIAVDEDTSMVEGKVVLTITYQIRATNSRFNFVYDFYRTEGVAP